MPKALPTGAPFVCGQPGRNWWRDSTGASGGPLTPYKRFPKGLKQFAVDWIALRIVFGMPLHAERKAGRVGNPDRLDGAVLGQPFYDDPLARFENTLAVQRINPDCLAAEDPRKRAAGNQTDFVPVSEHHIRIGVDFAVLEPWHPVI